MADIPEEAVGDIVLSKSDTSVPNSPYSQIRREISEEDLASPAVQRILLGEVDKLQHKVETLEVIESKFHVADKKSAILEEKLRSVNSQDILYSACLTIGSAIIGLSSMVWEKGYGPATIAIGSVLVVVGIVSRLMNSGVIKWGS